MVAITSFDREHIFEAVKLMYTQVANHPETEFHFPTGRWICEVLGYPNEQLDAIPETAMESFAGVGYPFRANVVKPGDIVLDIGAGAGTDALIASLIVGTSGKVYGLDMTRAMQEKLARNIEQMGASNVEPLLGNAEDIPLDDNSVDVVTSNGVLNLMPDKPKVFAEIFRVLKPGGQFQISDIIVNKSADELDESKKTPELWAECVAGAVHRENYINGFIEAGFKEVELHTSQNYFSNSSSESTRNVAEYFQAESITISGKK